MKTFNTRPATYFGMICLVTIMVDFNLSRAQVSTSPGYDEQPEPEQLSFCYKDPSCGPSTWPGICQTGRSQSPIDLPYNHFDHMRHARQADLLLNSEYFREKEFNLTNTGNTVQVSFRDDLTPPCALGGSLLPGEYIFSQLHFHWGSRDCSGSEHTLNGQRYPMEAHLVHYSSEFRNFSEALKSNKIGAIAVVGIFFRITPSKNKALYPIILGMKKLSKSKETVLSNSTRLNLSQLLLHTREKNLDVFQYLGSLTTPTCNEGVLWNIYAVPAPISSRQMLAFRTLGASSLGKNSTKLINNFRPTQKRNGRDILAVLLDVQKDKHSPPSCQDVCFLDSYDFDNDSSTAGEFFGSCSNLKGRFRINYFLQ